MHDGRTRSPEEISGIPPELGIHASASALKNEHGSCIGAVMLLNENSSDGAFEWGEFADMMNHRIRNAVTPISAFGQFVREEFDEESLLNRVDRLITGPSEALVETVEKLSYFAASSSFDPVSCDLKMIVEKAIDDLIEKHDERAAQIRCEWQVENSLIVADEKRLAIAIGKVLENSIEAIEGVEDGAIAVRITDHADASAATTADQFEISIIDNGKGMKKKDIHRAFKLFYTTKWTTGLGLGLPTAKNIIDNHGGRMKIISIKGEGTIVKIILPKG
jgi:nitrogen fixation/metabolism regulation signal transduction histidine kinase